jgi:hypothetical protein
MELEQHRSFLCHRCGNGVSHVNKTLATPHEPNLSCVPQNRLPYCLGIRTLYSSIFLLIGSLLSGYSSICSSHHAFLTRCIHSVRRRPIGFHYSGPDADERHAANEPGALVTLPGPQRQRLHSTAQASRHTASYPYR